MTKEIWRPVKSSPRNYMVSNRGRVRSVDRTISDMMPYGPRIRRVRGKILSPSVGTVGYPHLTIDGRSESVHRLVADAFIPNPRGLPEVNHLDRNRANNMVENLEWTTPSGNLLHVTRGFGVNTGSRNGRSKVTEDDVIEIRRLKSTGAMTRAIARKYRLTESHVSCIITGRFWAHLDATYH